MWFMASLLWCVHVLTYLQSSLAVPKRVGLATPSPKSSDTFAHPLFEGMSELVKVRPENPVEWLASYLVRNDPQKAGAPGPAK